MLEQGLCSWQEDGEAMENAYPTPALTDVVGTLLGEAYNKQTALGF